MEPPSQPSSSLPVHRLRFLPFSPSAPTSLALSPRSFGSTGRSLLAIGRHNGNIDLCTWVAGAQESAEKAWLPHTTLVPATPNSRKIDALAFAITSGENYSPERLRLFSISGGSILTEHPLPKEFTSVSRFNNNAFASSGHDSGATATTARTLASHGGVIWCMAVSPLSRYIAIGCEDGHIRFVDIREGRFEHLSHTNAAKAGQGEVVARTDAAKTRLVSLAWGPPNKKAKQKPVRPQAFKARKQATDTDSDSDSDSSDEDEEDWTESFLLAGTTSSLALLYALPTGRVTQKLLLPKARNEQTIVWSVAVLPDKTLVTGDSLGFVTFYDAKSRVPLPDGRFQVHDKGADILCLTVGPDGKTVYSGSVDQKVCEYALLQQKWSHTGTRRLHAHDVSALVIDPPVQAPKSPLAASADNTVPILISASADFNVVLTPASPPSDVTVRRSRKKKSKAGPVHLLSSSVNPVSSNPITTFAGTTQRRMPYTPSSSAGSSLAGSGIGQVSLCTNRGWAVLRTESSIEIWEVQKETQPLTFLATAAPAPSATPNYRRLLQMDFTKRRSKLIAHSISPDGSLLAVSDLHDTKVFALKVSLGELQPRKLKSFPSLFSGQHAPAASALSFTPGARLLMASWPAGIVYVIAIAGVECQIIKAWTGTSAISGRRAVAGRSSSAKSNGHSNGASSQGDEDISSESDDDEEDEADAKGSQKQKPRLDHLVVTPDLQYLICTSENHIWSYNLDVLSLHPRVLPSLPSRPVGVACHPTEPTTAAVALQDGSIRVIHLDESSTSASGKESKLDLLAQGVAAKLAGVRDSPTGISWVASQHGPVLVVHGATWLLTARERTSSLEAPAANGSASAAGKRRARLAIESDSSDEATGANAGAGANGEHEANGSGSVGGKRASDPASKLWTIRLTFRYQPLVHVGALRPAEEGSAATADDPQVRMSDGTVGLAVVERPFFELARELGGAWKRERQYGQ